MTKLPLILVGAIYLGATLPALAGPDWQMIERARENQRAQVAEFENLATEQKCSARKLVMPLDHGPRAQTTPYLNKQRQERFEAELKACREATGKGVAK